MISTFKKNQIIKIVPQEVEASCNLQIVDCCEEFLTVKKEKENRYEITGKVECFTMADDGVIYFNSKISRINDELYKLTLPISHNILQRREYTRIEFNSSVILKSTNNEIEAKIIDLSAGGMRVSSTDELAMSADYSFNLMLDKTQTITAEFSPIREDKNNDDTYITSGKFKMISNKDRILLAQFCFKKHMENTNK